MVYASAHNILATAQGSDNPIVIAGWRELFNDGSCTDFTSLYIVVKEDSNTLVMNKAAHISTKKLKEVRPKSPEDLKLLEVKAQTLNKALILVYDSYLLDDFDAIMSNFSRYGRGARLFLSDKF